MGDRRTNPYERISWVRMLMSDPEVRDQTVHYHRAVYSESLKARAHYERTGTPISLDQVPTLNIAWQAAFWAVHYALQLNPEISALPKRFTWLGVEYLLTFPAEGPVQISTVKDQVNLCVGLPGWLDPQTVKPKA